MKTMSMADVRTNLRALLDEVESTHERVAITRNGQPAAVLIALDDLESLEETLEVMGDPELVAEIREAEADIAAGRVFTLEEVVAGMRAAGRIA